MPYIKQVIKDTIELPYVKDDGQLTYAIDAMAESLLAMKCDYDWDTLSYSHLAQVIGDIECAKIELARRVLALLEDRKIVENGEVFESVATLSARYNEARVAAATRTHSVQQVAS